MAKKKQKSGIASAKRRTREHVIEDLSVHHITGMIVRCGHTVQKVSSDYGYDLWLQTFNELGEVENDYVQMQVKASQRLQSYELKGEDVFSYPIESRDYVLWRDALLPVFFILYDAEAIEAYWLDIQDDASTKEIEPLGEYTQLHVPRSNIFGVQTVRRMRRRKQELVARIKPV